MKSIYNDIIKILFIIVAISGLANWLFDYNVVIDHITDAVTVMSMIAIFVVTIIKDEEKDRIFKEEGWVK